jgi:hypothetical protein
MAELLLQLSTYEEATQLLGGNPRRPRTAERIEDEISLTGRSQKRPAHQAQGFLSGLVTVQLLLLWDGRDASDGGELGAGSVYEVVVEGVACPFTLARPEQSLVGVGPRKPGQRRAYPSAMCLEGTAK